MHRMFGHHRPTTGRLTAVILGIGTDLADVVRIEGTLARFGDRFTQRVFTEDERRAAGRRASPASRYAMFFAAKEACAKALGTGFRRGVFWRDLRVTHLRSGKPVMNPSVRQRSQGGGGPRSSPESG